ncbi:hypothetical protein GUITHDRAFT_105427 [Guillardia theta CCMP2712]|uniref:F-box domain-containing protein n=1 Tax=Guillardia theta (strain CCMP2712) TaxID=905079 RepID=L1JJW2_GUITC|nr:hypothetical protein GUITHDRAFT_105427 [Guillardia theta CCMP2712]EKX48803.1 hypothetical protein GUITHDRAFT_105427 [Guillardia theta CCMP2712]|eukprot:XP_005835783.1 hypothetical protein GUITHDRAFT_105427 [Guillardia theta CCMP2712]
MEMEHDYVQKKSNVAKQQLLLLTDRPHNKCPRVSPTRHFPFRGVSQVTVKRFLENEDAMQRVLMEFNSVTEVESLRKCNRTLRTLVDEHPKLWKHVTFSPPGLARLSRHGEMLQAEKILRKGAKEGNTEAQIMLALMYHHGYTCPCHPLALPGAH